MLTDDNNVVTTWVYVGQPLAFIQRDDFVSIMSQLLALLDKRSLVWFHFLFSTFCGLQNTAFLQINGSDKLECYTHSL